MINSEMIELFANENELSYSDSCHLLREFDSDPDIAKHGLETRFRPAAAVWETLRGRFGFQQPFPVHVPWRRGVYTILKSLTLQRAQYVIHLSCSTEYLSKPGTWEDGAKASFSHDFHCLPQVKDLAAAFEHWVAPERSLHFEQIQLRTLREYERNDPLFCNPASWTLDSFLERERGCSIRKAGQGTLLTLNMGCLGYFGASTSIYLLSKNGRFGAITTRNGCYFDVNEFRIGDPGDEGFATLPVVTESPIEFVRNP